MVPAAGSGEDTEAKRSRLQQLQQQAVTEARRELLRRRQEQAHNQQSMTVYEVQGPDGKTYEVQAPDMQSAVNATKSFTSNTSTSSLPAVPPELANLNDRAMAGELPAGRSEQNELLGGVLPSPRQATRNLIENLLGDTDPNSLNRGELVGSLLNKAGESFSLGLAGDETSAAVEAAIGLGGTPENAEDQRTAFERRRDHNRQQQAVLERDHPVLSFGADMTGALASAAIPVGTLAKGAGLAKQALVGAASAGAQGATMGFMEGEGDLASRLDNAKNAGLLSAGFGAAAVPLTRGVGAFLNRRATRKAIKEMIDGAPSVDDPKSRASEFFDAGRARGNVLSPEESGALAQKVRAKLQSEGVMRADGSLITRDPDTRRIVQELEDLARFGLEGNQVKPVRELFKAAAGDRDPARARIGKILLNQFDDFVGRKAPEFRQGDKLFHRAKKAETVDQMIDLADTSDSANALRREFQKADRKNIQGQSFGMAADEVAAMQRVARGTAGENFARGVGRSAPRSLTSAMFTGSTPLIAGSLAGSPGIGGAVGAAALGLGLVGRGLSNRAQAKNANIARALMASGGELPHAQITDATRDLIDRLVRGVAARGGPQFAGP